MSAKLTLLEMVQDILGAMESDVVNSVTDTEQAKLVANEIRNVYYQLVAQKDTPEHEELTQLEALSDTDKPNYLKIPAGYKDIRAIRYDHSGSIGGDPEMKLLKYLHPEDFLRKVLTKDTEDTILVTDFSGSQMYIKNTVHPTYWTSFDDEHIVTDAYKGSLESTLQQSRSLALSTKLPTFSVSNDAFVPDLDEHLFPLLLAEAKSTAMVNIKQLENRKVEQQVREQKINRRRYKSNFKGILDDRPNYGRK